MICALAAHPANCCAAPPTVLGNLLAVPRLTRAMVRVRADGIRGGKLRSGKSTVARKLAASLGVPHLELDSAFTQPGWEPCPGRIPAPGHDADSQDGWVVDGNYSAVQPIVWAARIPSSWLDLPGDRDAPGHLAHRAPCGDPAELWNGNREPLRTSSAGYLRSPSSRGLAQPCQYRNRYGAAAADPANAHLIFIRLTSRRHISRFLADPLHYAHPSA